ncbi:hypothetical protein SASPL_101931 [Salvia splendens]|uniref:Uncharacterized protein n=1 Tax=Salvia splendens TaxID=180675 RepID=A0A8X9AE25_SALSN|nr:uncharacterized protein LOC121766423 [Salvia splendens]KAG6437024.1 hypothetical protein SASPL_101931 [Salvia splendens]
MPSLSSDDFHQKSFKIKPDDDKLFSKLLSRESAKSSFRVYYGDAPRAVPFVWETRPGTPKHNSAGNNQIPPLTPPPSYYTTGGSRSSGGGSSSKLLIHSFLRRMNPKRAAAVSHSSSSLSSISWSSSSNSSFSDPLSTPAYVSRRRRFKSCGSSFDDIADDDGFRSSRMCFGIGGGGGRSVKRALLSIVGRGSDY